MNYTYSPIKNIINMTSVRRTDNLYSTMYSSRAHVFQIDELREKWIDKAEQAIPISLVATIVNNDPTQTGELSKRELRLIANNDNGDPILDVSILAKTTFIKRSQKFGQWIDFTDYDQTVYGLGFNTEAELNEFTETFQRLQRDILSSPGYIQSQSQPTLARNLQSTQPISQQVDRSTSWTQQQQFVNNVSETNGSFNAQNSQQYSNTLSHPGHHQAQIRRQQKQVQSVSSNNGDLSINNGEHEASAASNTVNYRRSRSTLGLESKTDHNNNNNHKTAGKMSPGTEISTVSHGEWHLEQPNQVIEQLKYENERLKHALEETTKNKGVWDNELKNLRTNNTILTRALEESKSHVKEWDRELFSLRLENKELKLRLNALDSPSDPEKSNENNDLQKYKNYFDEIQSELRKKENEIEELQKSMQELEIRNASLSNGQFEETPSLNSQKRRELEVIYAKFKSKLRGLVDVEKELESFITNKT